MLVPALHFFASKTRTPSGCLVTGGADYGNTPIGRAHRVALMFATGSLAEGKLVCHHCDNKPCVEPGHLYAGTSADNNRDTKARITPKETRSNLPKFTTWKEWVAGGWKATDVPLVRDSEGIPDELGSMVDLSATDLRDVDSADVIRAVEENAFVTNPDLWSEDDERSLMVLGCLDGHEPYAISTKTFGKYVMHPSRSFKIRRAA